jgi:hypothetical protein
MKENGDVLTPLAEKIYRCQQAHDADTLTEEKSIKYSV